MPLSSLSSVTWASVGDWLMGTPLKIAVTLAIALITRWLLHRVIDGVVESATNRHTDRLAQLPGARRLAEIVGVGHERHVQRTRTTGALLRNVVTVVIGVVTGLTIMALLEIPLAPMLASAGVGGVALGFGAQSLVKDYLSGIFMIIEDQYGVGDVIDTGEVVGTVENVSLRVTQVRDASGVAWYIRNGEIVRIGNKSQGWSTAIVDVPIAYDEDAERAQGIIRTVADTLAEDEAWQDRLLEKPTVAGIESIAGGAITIRILAKCAPQEHFGVQRELRERIKAAFDREGVRTPAMLPVYPPLGPGGPAGTG